MPWGKLGGVCVQNSQHLLGAYWVPDSELSTSDLLLGMPLRGWPHLRRLQPQPSHFVTIHTSVICHWNDSRKLCKPVSEIYHHPMESSTARGPIPWIFLHNDLSTILALNHLLVSAISNGSWRKVCDNKDWDTKGSPSGICCDLFFGKMSLEIKSKVSSGRTGLTPAPPLPSPQSLAS